MGKLLGLLAGFLLFGWALPTWGWTLCPLFLGVALFLAGLGAMVSGSRDPGLTSGFGGVIVAFLGICVFLGGLVAAGHADAAEAILNGFNVVPEPVLYGGSFALGIILAALARVR